MNINGLIAAFITVLYLVFGAMIWVCPVKQHCSAGQATVQESMVDIDASADDETEAMALTEASEDASEPIQKDAVGRGTDDTMEAPDSVADVDTKKSSDDASNNSDEKNTDDLTSHQEEVMASAAEIKKEAETKKSIKKAAENQKKEISKESVKEKVEKSAPVREQKAELDKPKANYPSPKKEVLYDDFPYHSVYFKVNEFKLKTDKQDQKFFSKLKIYLDKSPETEVTITGHADSSGIEMFNHELGGNRAGSLKEELIKAGIPAERLKTKSYGELRPKASNSTEAGRAKNRRAEIIID